MPKAFWKWPLRRILWELKDLRHDMGTDYDFRLEWALLDAAILLLCRAAGVGVTDPRENHFEPAACQACKRPME